LCVPFDDAAGSSAGILGDLVAISKDKSKITVITETAFSKRHGVSTLYPPLHH
jgi:hypothetical protein